MSIDPSSFVSIGTFGASHGVKGLIKVFTSGDTLSQKKPPITVYTKKGQESFTSLSLLQIHKQANHFLVQIDGFVSKESVAVLTNSELFLPKEELPQTEHPNEIYTFQLLGLQAVPSIGGEHLGYEVTDVIDNPAHPILEFKVLDAKAETLPTILVPFLDQFIGNWDIHKQEIEVKQWEQWFEV
ncbi:ribosome maturation factor RimM [Leptospira ryugenii]|uniref:Ribosome maturation factor RimM n=1 Tax=Leptospira ryugenii TaxID=1917863 RepID=A0A2P2DWQ5_9LEPT|nr:ribosome maturation factor RimM [Leptospira ryugenii]GBF49059.1 ribosome maturation factor RimM [Leptospira ryugenii]